MVGDGGLADNMKGEGEAMTSADIFAKVPRVVEYITYICREVAGSLSNSLLARIISIGYISVVADRSVCLARLPHVHKYNRAAATARGYSCE